MSHKTGFCIFCGEDIRFADKSSLLPFPKNPYRVNSWCQKFNVEPYDINFRTAKICLVHYNLAIMEEEPATPAIPSPAVARESNQKLGKQVCIICTLVCKTGTLADPFELIPFPKDEDVKRAWSEKFGVDLTPINHNAASICLEHYEQASSEAVKVQQVKPGTCLVCNFTRWSNKVEKSQLIPFPKDETLRQMWASKLGIALDLTRQRGASICLEHYKTVRNFKAVEVDVVDRKTCLVCRVQGREQDIDKQSLMPFPLDEDLKTMWAEKFHLRPEWINSKSARICVNHYKEAEGGDAGSSRKYKRTFNQINYKINKSKERLPVLDKTVCMACGLKPENPAILIPFPYTKNDTLRKIWVLKLGLTLDYVNQRNARICVAHFQGETSDSSENKRMRLMEPETMSFYPAQDLLESASFGIPEQNNENYENSDANNFFNIKTEPDPEPETETEVVVKVEPPEEIPEVEPAIQIKTEPGLEPEIKMEPTIDIKQEPIDEEYNFFPDFQVKTEVQEQEDDF